MKITTPKMQTDHRTFRLRVGTMVKIFMKNLFRLKFKAFSTKLCRQFSQMPV